MLGTGWLPIVPENRTFWGKSSTSLVTSRPENSDPFMAQSIHPLPFEEAKLHNVLLAGTESRRSLVRILGALNSSDYKMPSEEGSVTDDLSSQGSQYSPHFTAGWNIVSYDLDIIFLCVINSSIISSYFYKRGPVYCLQTKNNYACSTTSGTKTRWKKKKTRKTCAARMFLTDGSLTFSLLVCAVIDLCVAPRSAVL